MKKLNQEEFINRSNKIHNFKYDYSLVEYVCSKTKVKIICHHEDNDGVKHGVFEQIPSAHMAAQGCPKCQKEKLSISFSNTQDQFIEKAKQVHGNKWDYSLVRYKNNKTKVKIICKEHGIFKQQPDSHLSGSKCPICSKKVISIKNTLTTEQWAEKASKIHNNRYNYSKSIYIGSKKKITIICNKHGEFEQLAGQHLLGSKCKGCIKEEKRAIYAFSLKEFIEKAQNIHKDKYDYSEVEYVNAHTKIKIKCKECDNIFQQTPSCHIYQKNGCPKCKESRGEIAIRGWLDFNNIKYISQKTYKDLYYKNKKRKLKFDFYLPDHNTCIEFNGLQHYKSIEYFGGEESFKDQKIRDAIKKEYCKNNRIGLLEIRYNQINEIENILSNYFDKSNIKD